ncbi:MAG TPA: FCD domain-containing protein, partial [SAR324 cluster bacterium]|nr:FCD domain-containing protein [SAR324 cluster bacterium]
LKELESIVKSMRKDMKKEGVMHYLQLDDSFHNSFFNYCENRYMKDTYRMINARVSALRNFVTGSVESSMQLSLEHHEKILESLKADKLDEAVQILENHIINWLKKVDIHPSYAEE